jgi:tight adherence protein B
MNPLWLRAIVLICVFGAVALGVETLVRWIVSRHAEGRAINFRLQMISAGRTAAHTTTILRRAASAIPTSLPPFAANAAQKLETILIRSQVQFPIERLLMIIVVAPLVLFFLVLLLMSAWWGMGINFGRVLISAAFAILGGAVLPVTYFNFRAARTRRKIQEQFPVALDVFVRGLRAGHPIASALELLTVEMPDPIGSEFGFAVDEVTYGGELRDALQTMAERWDLDDLRMFVVSLSIQSQTGGNLAEILENLSMVIRERASMMMKVRALSSEGRMTGLMLTMLPLVTFVVLFVFNPRFFLDVASDPWFVPGFLGLALLYLVGFFWIRRMIDLKV